VSSFESSKLPSEKSFGFLFSFIFIFIGAYCYYVNINFDVVLSFFAVAIMLLTITLLFPNILTPFNKAWFLFGHLLGKITNPLVLGIIFFLMITPLAFFLRAMGRDELRLQKKGGDTYWIHRRPTNLDPESFSNQF
jgi:hypothetical protein